MKTTPMPPQTKVMLEKAIDLAKDIQAAGVVALNEEEENMRDCLITRMMDYNDALDELFLSNNFH